MVPRTVAEEFRPPVRKRPRALARKRRTVRRESPAADALRPRAEPQRLKLPPFRLNWVRPRSRRLRDWSTWNTPWLNLPDCVRLPCPVALTISTVPRLVSRKEGPGISRASSRGTHVRHFRLVRALGARGRWTAVGS